VHLFLCGGNGHLKRHVPLVADDLGIDTDQLLAQAEKRYRAKINTFDRFPWPRPINGLFIAKDMTKTPPTIQRTIAAHQAEPCAPRHFANSSEVVAILSR
jgi:hypothetical protein